MAQFGAGPDLAAQCATLPPPNGWRPWNDADGPIPPDLLSRSQTVAADQSVALGTTESYALPGVTTMIRVEPILWGKDAQGNVVQGCFRTGVIWLPSNAPAQAPADSSNLNRTVLVLTAVSLVIGIGATLWGLHK